MKKYVFIALATALSTSTVFAADLYLPMSPATAPMSAVSAYDWSGFYAGVNLGYGWAESELLGSTTDEFEGILGGAQVGYNQDMGGFVLGVEGDFQFSDITYEENDIFGSGIDGTAKIDNFGTLRARAGLAVDRFMPYVTGGLAIANASIEFTDGIDTIGTDDTYIGYTVGGGVEFAMIDNVTVKAEYLYADFGDADFDTGADISLDTHIVRAGVNFKF